MAASLGSKVGVESKGEVQIDIDHDQEGIGCGHHPVGLVEGKWSGIGGKSRKNLTWRKGKPLLHKTRAERCVNRRMGMLSPMSARKVAAAWIGCGGEGRQWLVRQFDVRSF
jgi:hypothetical protein